MKKYYLLTLFLILSASGYAQTVGDKLDSLKAKRKNSFLVVPLVFSTPETNWAFGLAGAYIFKTNKLDTMLRTSTVPFGFTYTVRDQFIAALGGNIFTPKERFIIRFENSFSKFPDYFWGIGNSTMKREQEFYSFTQYFINPQLHKKVYRNVFVGGSWDFQEVFDVQRNLPQGDSNKVLPKSYFETDNVLGANRYYISGPGLIFTYDNRTHAYIPEKGGLFRVKYVHFDEFFGGGHSFDLLEIDIRKFQRIYKKHIIGFHSYNFWSFGDVPYRSMGSLGGNNIMRGYYQGRFRDKKSIAAQIEYRYPICWRFSGVAFAGVGQVMNDFSDFAWLRYKYSIGAGIRFSILPKEKLNLRFDIGFGNESSVKYYVVVAESF
ncbi:MAG: BamA/TamA family outer membrane protein [Cytophagales bacterium]|nr:BamA/TamA family outer membrane protein [Cytophagales bacterium]